MSNRPDIFKLRKDYRLYSTPKMAGPMRGGRDASTPAPQEVVGSIPTERVPAAASKPPHGERGVDPVSRSAGKRSTLGPGDIWAALCVLVPSGYQIQMDTDDPKLYRLRNVPDSGNEWWLNLLRARVIGPQAALDQGVRALEKVNSTQKKKHWKPFNLGAMCGACSQPGGDHRNRDGACPLPPIGFAKDQHFAPEEQAAKG